MFKSVKEMREITKAAREDAQDFIMHQMDKAAEAGEAFCKVHYELVDGVPSVLGISLLRFIKELRRLDYIVQQPEDKDFIVIVWGV